MGNQVEIFVSFASDWLREKRKFSGPITDRIEMVYCLKWICSSCLLQSCTLLFSIKFLFSVCLQIKYVKYSSQLSFLRLLSDRARQNITYHCKDSVAWYDQELDDVTKSLKIKTDNGVIIHSSSSNKFKPSVLADNCRVSENKGRMG